MPPKKLSYKSLRGPLGGTTGPLYEQRTPQGTGGISITLRPPVLRYVTQATRDVDTGHGVLGFPSTGVPGSFQRSFNTETTPVPQQPSMFSGFNAVNNGGSVAPINLAPLFDSVNESDVPFGEIEPTRSVNRTAAPNTSSAESGLQTNNFTNRPDSYLATFRPYYGNHDYWNANTQPTDLQGSAVSGARDLFSSFQQTLANPSGRSLTDRLTYLTRRIHDGFGRDDPAIHESIPDNTTPETTAGNSINPTSDQAIATPMYGSAPRHGGQDNSTQNNVAVIHSTVQGPQGMNDFANIQINNTPIMPQTNNDASGVHASMGGSSGPVQQVDGSWTLDVNPLQPATTLQMIAPAADIPVRTAGPAQLTVKTPSQAQYWASHKRHGQKPVAVFA